MAWSEPIDFADLEVPELMELLAGWDAQPYHAKQIFAWIHRRGATEFGVMTDLSMDLRRRLQESGTLRTPRIARRDVSSDGTTFNRIGRNGWGDPANSYAWRFHTYGDKIWFGAMNIQIGQKGGSLWNSTLGVFWDKLVGLNGQYFGYGFDDLRNWGIRTFAEFQGDLYIGTAQCWFTECQIFVSGAEIWRWNGCEAQ